jgi:hypothetical protein
MITGKATAAVKGSSPKCTKHPKLIDKARKAEALRLFRRSKWARQVDKANDLHEKEDHPVLPF